MIIMKMCSFCESREWDRECQEAGRATLKRNRRILIFLLLVLFSCKGPGATDETQWETATVASEPSASLSSASATISASDTSPPSDTAPPSKTPAGTPTPDLRLPAEQWQSWPIVPERVSDRMRAVYFNGLAAGNNPQAFSKVGDCQNIPNAFLGLYDKPGRYTLDSDAAYLQETIEHFQGSFWRESQAVRGGFNVASVLSPLWADLEHCRQGETPLDCELRLHRPSIVFISMETWFKGRTPEVYEGYLRQIVDRVIEYGAVPILATKADNTEGDHGINGVIARLAYDYDLPLWNFWLAVQPLPDHGIDWERDSTGFHILYEAWSVRSYTALQSLDQVWRQLNAQLTEEVHTATPKPSAYVEPTPPAITPISGPSEGLILSFAEQVDWEVVDSGLFLFRPEEGRFDRLTDAGYRLQDASPDGRHLLVNKDRNLFVMDMISLEALLLNQDFFAAAQPGAYWQEGSERVFFIASSGGDNSIMSCHADGSDQQRISAPEPTPIDLIPTGAADKIYWMAGDCSSMDDCIPMGLYWISSHGLEMGELAGVGSLRGAKNDTTIAYTQQRQDSTLLKICAGGDDADILVRTTANTLLDYALSPDGSRLAAIEVVQSAYSGRRLEYHYLLASSPAWTMREIFISKDLSALLWSADSQTLWFLGTSPQNEGYAVSVVAVEADARRIISSHDLLGPWGGAYTFIRNSSYIRLP